MWLGQPHLLRKLKDKFGYMTNGLQVYKTPGTPNQGIVRPANEDEKVSIEEQKLYCTGVGMLLYLVKYSRPDLSNTI